MYRKQVRSFIKKNQGTPLSRTTMDICLSYLAFKYISHNTKISVLNELSARAYEQTDARLVHSLLLEWDLVTDLLDSPEPGIRRDTCNLLGAIAASYAAEPWSSEVNIDPLSSASITDGRQGMWTAWLGNPRLMLPPASVKARRRAGSRSCKGLGLLPRIYVLGRPPGVQEDPRKPGRSCGGVTADSVPALVANKRLDRYISNLLDSSDTETRRWSCEFLGNSANYWISLDTDIYLKITSLLGDQDECVREAAAATIAKMVLIRTDAISRRPGILKHLLEHLDSPDARIRQFVCIVLGKFAVYLPTPSDLLNLGPTAWIAPLLRYSMVFAPHQCLPLLSSDADAGVRRHAAHALANISFWRGATEAFDAPTIQLLLDLLKSTQSSSDTQRELCEVLSNLAFHDCPLLVQLGTELYARVVYLLSSENAQIRNNALSTLHEVTSNGAVEECTKLWEFISGLLNSGGPRFHHLSIRISGVVRLDTICADRITLEVLPLLPSGEIMLMISKQQQGFPHSPMSFWPQYVKAAVDAGTLEHVPDLLASPDVITRKSTYRLLENIASDPSMAAGILEAELLARIPTGVWGYAVVELFREGKVIVFNGSISSTKRAGTQTS
ncbi:armadillo-type protein [Mycena metata]|uniref:non-specific serine/threonine protein kinase n=1 Tax=Mycena metata TaxID=1033252 RepID=A0AAD7MS59_9AGAR|nr:armadillo-type protein [Mycena metata]